MGRFFRLGVFVLASCFWLFTGQASGLTCIGQIPVAPLSSTAALDLIQSPPGIAELLGEPDLTDPEPLRFRALVRNAFRALQYRVPNLQAHEKAFLWEAFARAIHRRFRNWASEGPFVAADGAYVFRGNKGNTLVIRDADARVFLTFLEMNPTSEWQPNYEELQTLEEFLEQKK